MNKNIDKKARKQNQNKQTKTTKQEQNIDKKQESKSKTNKNKKYLDQGRTRTSVSRIYKFPSMMVFDDQSEGRERMNDNLRVDSFDPQLPIKKLRCHVVRPLG